MLYIVLADSELETVPQEIASHKSIKWRAQKRGRKPTDLILDSNYFHRAMRKLPDSRRRGRPDIAHVCMLAALDSPLNREGLLGFYVHTRHDMVIEVNKKARIPRSYNRFIGLMEQAFLIGKVPPDNPLLSIRDRDLAGLLREIGLDRTIVFSESGKEMKREKIFQGIEKGDDLCMIVGGFPHGDFLTDVEKISDVILKLYSEPLDALTALGHAIYFYEDEYDIL